MTVLGPPGLYSGGLKSSTLPKMSKTMIFFVISFLNVEEVLNFLFIYCDVVGSAEKKFAGPKMGQLGPVLAQKEVLVSFLEFG